MSTTRQRPGETILGAGGIDFGLEPRDCEVLRLAKPRERRGLDGERVSDFCFSETVGNLIFRVSFIFY
jgi:hypothetical protein